MKIVPCTLCFLSLPFIVSPSSVNRRSDGKRSFAKRDDVAYTVYEHRSTRSTMSYVKNSGICETTPGVNQYSGYFSVGTDMNMWFWFFEARNNATTAPLATWFNGGPGCSSLIGLFQENGPCQFYNGSDTPSLNPYSWNNYANMLYIDQPIGVGFSYGDATVNSTVAAAPYVWKFLQAFYDAFPEYENRDFGIFTESYGGHYGPEFAEYFQRQNSAITNGTVQGESINLKALGINNGWYHPIHNYKAFVTYAYYNDYFQMINASQYESYLKIYNEECLPALKQCPGETGNDEACAYADQLCRDRVETPLEDTLGQQLDFDPYDIRGPYDDPNPPDAYVDYLNKDEIKTAIGAQGRFQTCSGNVSSMFSMTGDDGRSFLSSLASVVQSGVRTILWAGDADEDCNFFGTLDTAHDISYNETSIFNALNLTAYTVNGNHSGDFKQAGNLAFLKVFQAGHEVPFYQPITALQVFWQIMSGGGLEST